MTEQPMKLLIAIPSNRDPKRAFTYSLVRLNTVLLQMKYEQNSGIEFDIVPFENVSDIALGRNVIAEYAIQGGYDYLLGIDDDMKFNPEALLYLLSRKKDVVSANCVTKISNKPTSSFKGELIYSAGKSGIEVADRTGFGFILINMDVFKRIERPFFESRIKVQDNDGVISLDASSEATYFCELLEKSDIHIYIDHDAQKHVWHVGTKECQE
jgi:hypothetical protein